MAVALRFLGAIQLEHFSDSGRRDPALAGLAGKLNVTAPPEIDQLYPQPAPGAGDDHDRARNFTRQADEALGSRLVPLDDAGLMAKFLGLVRPVLGAAKAKELDERITWSVEEIGDVAPLVESIAK